MKLIQKLRSYITSDLQAKALILKAATEIERLRLLIRKISEGHNSACYYCKLPCNSLAANPSEWPIPLCHSNEPGKVKFHHIGCVVERLKD